MLHQILGTALAIPALAITVFLIKPTVPFVLPVNIVFAIILITLLFLNRLGYTKPSGIVIVCVLTFLSTFFNYLNGGEIRAFILITVIAILMSGLLLGSRAPIIVALFLAIQYVVIALLRANGLIVAQGETTFAQNMIVVLVGYSLITIIYRLAISKSQVALELARESEKSLQVSNRDLKTLTESLEQHVKERTQDAEKQQQSANRRSRQFEGIFRVSRAIATAKNLQEILPQITQVISEQFGYYHVGVFLNDSINQYAILSAANSEGGQRMLNRGHQLKIGQQGIVGYVTSAGIPRIALDVGADSVYFNNPDLPLTHSEMALPLKAGTEIMGALDIQSTEQNAFTQEDVEILEALAEQVSLAIQNTRLLEQTTKLLVESEAIQKQYQKDTWGRLSREKKLTGYKYTITGTNPLADHENIEATSSKREVAVPISLRGEKIGTLIVQVPINEKVSSDQMDLIRAVAERVALSAENARLFEETNRRAEREQVISDISAKISTSVRTENILKTTAQELNQILDGAEVLIKLGIDGINKMSEPISIVTNPAADQRERNTYRFSVGAAILFTIILLITFVVNQSVVSDVASTTSLLVCIVCFIISAYISRRGMSTTGSLIMIASLILFTLTRVFITKGLAIPSGVINVIVVSTIAVYTLPHKWVNRVITIAFINAAVSIFVDQITTGIPTTDKPQISNIISIAIGIVYLFILLLQFPRLTLRSKLIVAFISLTALPIFILGTLTYQSTHDLLAKEINQEIERIAISSASSFQDFVDKQLSTMQTQANSKDLVNFILLSPLARPGSAEKLLAEDELNSFRKNSPAYISSYLIVDMSGESILDTNPATLGKNYSSMQFFTYIESNKEEYTSGLATVPGEKEYVIYFAVPIFSESGELIGMYVRIYNANVVQTVMNQVIRSNGAPGRATQYNYILDGTNFFVLAHSVRTDLNYKTYLRRDDHSFFRLINLGLIDPKTGIDRFLALTDAVDILTAMGATGSFVIPSPVNNNESAESTAVRIRNSDWILLTSEPTNVITDLIQNQTRTTVFTSILLLSVAALLALLVANFFTRPLTELTQIAQSISAGDYHQKATIRARDEIGLLADSINVMSEEIQQSIEKLESRVERRTADLSLANQQSEKRAQNLQTIAEISRIISTEKDQEKLLSLITQIVSEKFGYYHVGIFLLDENRTYAVLRAANSVGGQEMLKRKHSLKVGQTGIVGFVTSSGTPRIALDTGADAVFFNNPSLPETHSEMALPLITRGAIIGALDVQSKVPNAFSDADISIISILADQVAIAIDNSRLLEAAQASIEETRAVFSEYLADAWQKKTETGVVGYRQTTSGGQVLTNANLSVLAPSNNGHGKPIEIPIRIRDQTIGVLNIRATSDDRNWSDDDLNVIEAVAERLGLALDNARLFEETSTRATRERLVADITTKIRGSNDPQEMIRTAMEELKQVLGASKVEILPNIKINHSSDK